MITLMVFVVVYGFISLGNTQFNVKTGPSDSPTKGLIWQNQSASSQDVLLFNHDFGSLLGILSAGYYLHQFALPICQKAAKPEKTNRNLAISYFICFVQYCVVGTMGYFAFSSETFKEYYFQEGSGIIN